MLGLPRLWHAFYAACARSKNKDVSWAGTVPEETGWPPLPISGASMRGFITGMNPKVLPAPLLATGPAGLPPTDGAVPIAALGVLHLSVAGLQAHHSLSVPLHCR